MATAGEFYASLHPSHKRVGGLNPASAEEIDDALERGRRHEQSAMCAVRGHTCNYGNGYMDHREFMEAMAMYSAVVCEHYQCLDAKDLFVLPGTLMSAMRRALDGGISRGALILRMAQECSVLEAALLGDDNDFFDVQECADVEGFMNMFAPVGHKVY